MPYVARYSPFNPIEHLWAPMSNALSGIILPSKLEGESTAPASQGKLANEEQNTKEKAIFNDAMEKCSQYWKHLEFNGNGIQTIVIKCGEDELLFDYYERVQACIKTSIGRLIEFFDLVKELRSMILHIERHHDKVVFIKCKDLSCC